MSMPADPAAERLPVVHFGLGPIGLAIARLVAERPALQSVGAIDIDPALAGLPLAEVAGVRPAVPAVTVSADATAVLASAGPGVVIHCTGSSLEQVLPQLLAAVKAGWSVVSTCEELSFPWIAHADPAARLDRAARARGVVVLGTGVNPGFAMDYLPVVLSGVARRVDAVTVHRVQDAGSRRLPLQRKVGAGLDAAEFRRRADDGRLGHVGLRESADALAGAFGWRLSRYEETIEPVVVEQATPSGLGEIQAGLVSGLRQAARGWIGDRLVIDLTLEMAVGLPDPRDEIRLTGDPDLQLVIPGGLHGDVATAAVVVNALSRLAAARPGLRVMADLPPPRP